MGKRTLIGCSVLVAGTLSAVPAIPVERPEIIITIIYDNTAAEPACGADWGFSCLIEHSGNTILFDMGAREDVFLKNVAALDIDLARVDMAIISHSHGDHTGGLDAALRKRPGLTVYVPADPGPDAALVSGMIEKAGGKAVSVHPSLELMKGLWLTGTMGTVIKEQSLVIDTARGLVIVTGCAHQGIVGILEKARDMTGRPIEAVLGGFHLMRTNEADLGRILARFKDLGVAGVGASHCTGDRAIALFREAYKDRFIGLGAGRVLRFLSLDRDSSRAL